MDRIKAALDAGATRAVVVGAGFIGLEVAENLVHRGVATTIVELQDQVLPPLDREMTAPILETLARHKVETILADSAAAFEQTDTGLEVVLTSGRRLPADLVLLGIGVRPESGLAAAAGLAVGPRGGIQVDAGMRTSDPAIWAVGDAVEIPDGVFGTPTQIPLAGPANRQGRLAADGMCGRAGRYRGSQGTSVVGVFKATAACTGCSEKLLRRAGRDYRKVYVHPANHAGYYPGAEPMSLKLLFDPADGRVLGAQGVGGAGVDKRIDVLAVAIQARMTVYDLEEMELCYAPQFGSAKDPVNMAGFVAAGLLRGDHPQESWEAVIDAETTEAQPLLLDVRTEDEFLCGEAPGAVNIPLDELRGRLAELPRDRRILCYCQVGQRGYYATRILLQHGFDAANLGGGFKTYKMLTATAAAAAAPLACR
jgi:rhodanese-related sulfurtransferase